MADKIQNTLRRKYRRRVSSFVRGAAQCLEIIPSRRLRRLPYKILIQSDVDAIREDWQTLGSDIWYGIEQAEKEKWAKSG